MHDWWYVSNGQRQGPISKDDLYRLLIDGSLSANSLVWNRDMKRWQAIGRIDELASLLPSTPPAIPNKSAGMRWRRMRRHLDSSIALVIGCLAVIAGLSRIALTVADPRTVKADTLDDTLIAGLVTILGALAYRSAKKRKLGEVKTTFARQILEVAVVVLIGLMTLAQRNFTDLLVTDPVPNAVIPIGAIAAYLAIAFMPAGFTQRPVD